jgi:transposase
MSVAVSRERKRAERDRLDAAILMRVFLGCLRGERRHCGMVAIPAMEEEDARRPSRERESLVNERSRIVNRMKSALARLGILGADSVGVALPNVPERQRAGAVVSHADQKLLVGAKTGHLAKRAVTRRGPPPTHRAPPARIPIVVSTARPQEFGRRDRIQFVRDVKVSKATLDFVTTFGRGGKGTMCFFSNWQ